MTVPAKKETLPTKPNLLQEAIAKGASIEVIERIMAMQERWEANEARKAFNTAIAAFKENPPEILKTVEVAYESQRSGSRTSYKHEDLSEMLAAIDPALAAHGLWVRFKINSAPGAVTVTCIIGHAEGHSEEPATLQGAPDTSGNKNAIQAIGSTVSYLQRYTLKAALGMAAARDDDGRASSKPEQEYIPHQTKSNPPHKIDIPFFPSGKHDWFSWGKELIAQIRSAKNKAEGEEWLAINAEALEACADEDVSVWDRFDTAVKTWRATP